PYEGGVPVVCFPQFFVNGTFPYHVQTETAVFLWNTDPEEPQLLCHVHDVSGNLVFFFNLLRNRFHFPLNELADHASHVSNVFFQLKVHSRSLPTFSHQHLCSRKILYQTYGLISRL